jgi:hypothetical protein
VRERRAVTDAGCAAVGVTTADIVLFVGR